MKKLVLINTRKTILETAEKFESFVCSTMGPDGQNIALHNDVGLPVITKDGVSVAKVIQFEEPEKELIAQILREAAEKTNTEAGDGTTTSTAIACATIREGIKLINSGNKVNQIRREVTRILGHVTEELNKMKTEFGNKTDPEIQDILYKISMISTNGDEEISKLISEAVTRAGRSGVVNVQKGATQYEIIRSEGMKIPNAGVVNYEFIRGNADKKSVLSKCRILITNYELESASILHSLEVNVLKPIMDRNESLLIIAKKADKSFLANMINNNHKGYLKNACVKAPYFGAVGREMMDDLAAMTGGRVIDENAGHNFASVTIEDLGYAESVEVNPWHTVLFKPEIDQERLDQRLEKLQKRAEELNFKPDADKVTERLSALTGSVFNIRIPSVSEIEDKERLDRIEDAINACRGAVSHGYLPGGGAALLRIADKLSNKNVYEKYVADIISYPFQRILDNCEIPSMDVQMKLVCSGDDQLIFDARRSVYGNAFEEGVIDSFKVVEKSLSNGVSVGLMLLSTTGIIADIPQESSSPFEFDMG